MSGEDLRIDELNIRVPGLSADEGRALGKSVANRVADMLPQQTRKKHLGALELKFSVPQNIGRQQMETMIAEAILKGLV